MKTEQQIAERPETGDGGREMKGTPFAHTQLPSSWRLLRLKDVVTFTKKPRGVSVNGPAVPFLPMALIPADRTYAIEFEERAASKLGSGTYVEPGDLLITKITPCFENRKQAIVVTDKPFAYATTEVIPIKGKPDTADTLFLHFVLLHPQLRKRLAAQMDGTTGRQRLRKESLEDVLIPVPPLADQRWIAAILSLVQRAIEQQEQLIALTTELKKALMHKLFTEGTRGEPLKETEVGMVPEGWTLVQFEDFAVLQRGKDLPKYKFRSGLIPVIGATTIIGYHDEPNVKGPGVTVVRSGSSAGKPLFIDSDFWAHNVVLYVKDFRGNNRKFVYYKILSLDLTRYKAGVAVPTLNRNTFRTITVAVPTLDEQADIAEMLETVETKRRWAVERKQLLQEGFLTVLHQLMAGQAPVDMLRLSTRIQ